MIHEVESIHTGLLSTDLLHWSTDLGNRGKAILSVLHKAIAAGPWGYVTRTNLALSAQISDPEYRLT